MHFKAKAGKQCFTESAIKPRVDNQNIIFILTHWHLGIVEIALDRFQEDITEVDIQEGNLQLFLKDIKDPLLEDNLVPSQVGTSEEEY